MLSYMVVELTHLAPTQRNLQERNGTARLVHMHSLGTLLIHNVTRASIQLISAVHLDSFTQDQSHTNAYQKQTASRKVMTLRFTKHHHSLYPQVACSTTHSPN